MQYSVRRASSNPPAETNISWEEYISTPPGQCPLLGRSKAYKECSKSLKASVVMSPDFPLSVDMLLNVLEVVAPFKHFNQFRELCRNNIIEL